ncbi:MAG: bifunctional homocysteine S-methyltransferase/methylenetetrahydrofolate reductase [Anaerolineales bacterium]|nr:bifunctional homocysteine S-methyltransferase/methylenetetrahydrofolate reductase [Anaerolineales bacterium]
MKDTARKFFDSGSALPLLADGAMGTLLVARGVPPDANIDELNLSRPGLVAQAHRDYLAAGAQILEANTFGANRFKLSACGLEGKQEAVIRAGVELARKEAGSSALVAGSIGPLGVRLAPYGRVKAEQAEAAFREQAALILQSGADLILIETMSDVNEALAALKAARAAGAQFVGVSFTFTRDGLTLLGDSPAGVARAAADAGADLIGVNCSSGPAQAIRILRAMRAAAPKVRFSAMPNAGWPERTGGRILYPAGAEYFGGYAREFAEAGASLIGGCCGTEPAHIAAMRAALVSFKPRSPGASVVVEASREERIPDAVEATQFAARLASGKFTISVEVDPPKGFSTHKLMAGASMLAEAGADVINVADSPMARMRMSPWAVCHLIQEKFGIETVLHFPTRGRNLLRLQGDLLAAHALGVRNLFVVMGDPAAIGDFPQAADNYDIVPSGLIRMIKQSFNQGLDHAGKDIGAPTAFFVGCALNLCSRSPEKEMKNLQKKIEAGADFILTQPVFEPGCASAFLESFRREYGELKAPILAGIMPLYGAKHAAFLHNEVPGMSIPEEVRARIDRAGERAPEEGVRIAVELLKDLRGIVQGAYLMPPFGRYDLAAEVIEKLA